MSNEIFNNKFGMFIHWGLYALTGLHEQAIARYDIDSENYEALMREFCPDEYDPEKWVLLAKKAGMKYICFTAKHHDGFCMWDTKETDYNVMNTPYGRDVLRMLILRLRKQIHCLQYVAEYVRRNLSVSRNVSVE